MNIIAHFKKVVNLIATPHEGFEFVNWTEGDNILSTEPSLTIIMDKDRVVEANFKELEYTLSIKINPENGGKVEVVS